MYMAGFLFLLFFFLFFFLFNPLNGSASWCFSLFAFLLLLLFFWVSLLFFCREQDVYPALGFILISVSAY